MKIEYIKNKLTILLRSQLFWLQVCAIGIWLLVIQNYLGREDNAQNVYVVGGNINADVAGYVDANVSGSVDVDNTVPVKVTNTVMTW